MAYNEPTHLLNFMEISVGAKISKQTLEQAHTHKKATTTRVCVCVCGKIMALWPSAKASFQKTGERAGDRSEHVVLYAAPQITTKPN